MLYLLSLLARSALSQSCNDKIFPIIVGGTDEETKIKCIAINSNQEIVAAGMTKSVDLGAPGREGFIAKYDSSLSRTFGKLYDDVNLDIDTFSYCTGDQNSQPGFWFVTDDFPGFFFLTEDNTLTGSFLKDSSNSPDYSLTLQTHLEAFDNTLYFLANKNSQMGLGAIENNMSLKFFKFFDKNTQRGTISVTQTGIFTTILEESVPSQFNIVALWDKTDGSYRSS